MFQCSRPKCIQTIWATWASWGRSPKGDLQREISKGRSPKGDLQRDLHIIPLQNPKFAQNRPNPSSQSRFWAKLGDPDTIAHPKSFEPQSILSISENPRVAQIEVIPRNFFILSNFGIYKVAQNEEIPRDYSNLSNSGILRNAQNWVWLEGFGVCS